METVFFGVKRMHLCVNQILKRVLRPSILTPARFDMLRLVGIRNGTLQRTIWYLLGVSRATASKMLKRLYLDGCIRREVDPRDRRQRIVWITEVGQDLLMRGYIAGIDTRVGEQMVKTAVAFQPHPPLDDRALQKKVFALEDVLVRARMAFRDRSPARNPWRSDDLATMERALEHDARPPEAHAGHTPDTEEGPLTSEEITLRWNPPRGYVPPPPDTMGLLG